jgi:hypothetical protein
MLSVCASALRRRRNNIVNYRHVLKGIKESIYLRENFDI